MPPGTSQIPDGPAVPWASVARISLDNAIAAAITARRSQALFAIAAAGWGGPGSTSSSSSTAVADEDDLKPTLRTEEMGEEEEPTASPSSSSSSSSSSDSTPAVANGNLELGAGRAEREILRMQLSRHEDIFRRINDLLRESKWNWFQLQNLELLHPPALVDKVLQQHAELREDREILQLHISTKLEVARAREKAVEESSSSARLATTTRKRKRAATHSQASSSRRSRYCYTGKRRLSPHRCRCCGRHHRSGTSKTTTTTAKRRATARRGRAGEAEEEEEEERLGKRLLKWMEEVERLRCQGGGRAASAEGG